MDLDTADWLTIAGLGCLWLGVQIALVGGLPRPLRRGEVPRAPRGTPEAFGLFWLDQYSFLGLGLAALGLGLGVAGALVS